MARKKQDISDEFLDRALKTLAEDRVMPPANFRRAVIDRIAAETGRPALREPLADRLRRWLATPAFAPVAAAGLALFIVAVFLFNDPATQLATSNGQMAALPETRVSDFSGKTDPSLPVGRQQTKKENSSSSPAMKAAVPAPEKNKNSSRVIENKAAPKENIVVAVERGAAPMPLRQPRSLQPLQQVGSNDRNGSAAETGPASAQPAVSRANVTREVTPQPTPVSPLRGFSEVRRNVFRPGLGEFVAIMVEIEKNEHVEIAVYDMNGRRVASLLDETRAAGIHEIRWSGYNDRGDLASSGKYIVVVKTLDKLERHKIALIR